MIREYIYLNSEPLTQINDGSPETPTYLHTDNLGTPRYGTSAAGSQVWAWDSDAFGNGTPSGSVTVNLRMAGQYHDAETGLFYNWNRYYNPEIGRYVSSDPIGLEGGINTFNYVEQNPLLYVDPEGLQIALPHPATVIPAALCALIPGCIENISDMAEETTKAAQIAAQNVAKAGKDVIQWCQRSVTGAGGPPGNCTPQEHRDLQDRVENAFGAAKRCSGLDSISTLDNKIGYQSFCIEARKRINNRCFDGGDKGHKRAIKQRYNSIRKCQNFMTQKGM